VSLFFTLANNMSWMGDFVPGGEMQDDGTRPRIGEDDNEPKVTDSYGRKVSTKLANQPYLKHQEYRKEQAAKLAAIKQRNKERLEKQARGEKTDPLESEDLEPEIGCWGFTKFLLSVFAATLLLGHFITGDPLWNLETKWRHLKTYMPSGQILFSESQLAKFDGSNEHLGVYVALDGDVYDVSKNRRTYGPGGSYAFMAGKDAARAFATGCFKEHRTHDVRGLDEEEQRGLEHWKNFFAKHKDYPKVGRVAHKVIDPTSPYPDDCESQIEAKRQRAERKRREAEEAKADSHQEL